MTKDLCGIIEHASSKGMYSVVVSNGNIFGNEKLANTVFNKSCDELVDFFYNHQASFIFKLETLDEQLYEKIVGVKGSFRQFMNGMDRVFRKGFTEIKEYGDGTRLTRIAFSGVISKQNFHEVPELKEFANKNHAQFICKFPSFIGNT